MNGLHVRISNEEIAGTEDIKFGRSNGILQFIDRYDEGTILTYYVSYEETETVLDEYNAYLRSRNMPLFKTLNAEQVKLMVDSATLEAMVLQIIKMLFKRLFIECALLA